MLCNQYMTLKKKFSNESLSQYLKRSFPIYIYIYIYMNWISSIISFSYLFQNEISGIVQFVFEGVLLTAVSTFGLVGNCMSVFVLTRQV